MPRVLTKFRHKTHLAVTLSLILLFLLFLLQNTEQVQVAFIFWTISLSRAFILLVTLLLGITIGIIAAIGKLKHKSTPINSSDDSERVKLQNKVLKRNALISKMQSDRKNDKQIIEAQEADRIEALGHLSIVSDNQQIAKEKLSATRAALSDAQDNIFSLEEDISQLNKDMRAKDFVEKIVQNDLRSALTISISLSESILADSNLTEDQNIIVGNIRDSGKKMLQTIDSSLTLYQLEEGYYKVDFVTVDLHDIISTVVGLIGETLSVSRINVSIDCMDTEDRDQKTFLVYGDAFLLHSTFMNLLVNAYEASPPEKTISIVLGKNDYCSVAIRNYGEVPESIRDTFFNKMITSGKKFGTGLGTYSAMKMVKAQNGNIELDCSEPGMTTIYVSLPKP
ncbi:HAMP domain-containing sensor histidine kinase [Pseudodesulfovibrio sp. zrk46]|uniref:sensor histidine kinase n=1 Tax=Pseudodesulfovibrio sp. zrk46 TaxID=2725288 RepID=UPI001449BC51|nr:HAMP domain-containing sensor histidine kinase [Pseudodesulfovibrio sp. zrk46]QJB55101.1 HAMP domain-containing histidine kinase [Pseudodesulfovibrio sp. zrk46]